uniref:EGF-like domain-containing protein n=1 Tax=Sphaeramia orbicularis TaxID=375764 RepID=A0A673AA13_9TELE
GAPSTWKMMCLAQNGTCEHVCINTQGSFQCSCRPGYQLHIDGHTCVGLSLNRQPHLQQYNVQLLLFNTL